MAMSDDSDPASQAAVEALGVRYIAYRVARSGLNPLKDLDTFRQLRAAIRHESPDRVLAYTIKPVIWGGLAARTLGFRQFYGLVTGLGFAFEGEGVKGRLLKMLVSGLYRVALRGARRVVFQNEDNRDLFVSRNIVQRDLTHRVHGSGIDLKQFQVAPLPDHPPIVFLCIARLLGHKGLREYAKAASQVKLRHPDARFLLVGATDPSPDGIPLSEVQSWHAAGTIEYLGELSDVRPQLAGCHVYVLPSYHEGLPRTVLEAMATSRPVLTTNVPGCRDTVKEGLNGFLVPRGATDELAERMAWFVDHADQLAVMGEASRELAENTFDVQQVNSDLLRLMEVPA